MGDRHDFISGKYCLLAETVSQPQYVTSIAVVANKFVFVIIIHTGQSQKNWRGGVAQWVARLTRNVEVPVQAPSKAPRCFLEQETLPLLFSTGWFQEQIRAWSHNQTKINWGPYGRYQILKYQINPLVKYRQNQTNHPILSHFIYLI